MSVATQNSRDIFTAAGGVGEAFATTFPFIAGTDLRVTTGPNVGGVPSPETLLVQGVDYSVAGGAYAVGTVTMITSRTAGHLVKVQRIVPYTQPTNLSTQGQLDPVAVMRALDRLEMQIQQLVDGVVANVIHGNQGGGSEHLVATAVSAGFESTTHFDRVENYIPQYTPIETRADLTLYVNPATGNDSNDGLSSGAPLLTLQRAVDKVPLFIRHAVVINVAAGTTNEKVRIDKVIAASTGGRLTILGTLAAVTPATGLASGNVASDSARTKTVTAAGWTVNDLRDKFLRTTVNGEIYPIVSNTATTVELATNDVLAGLAFDIVEPVSIVNGGTAAGEVGIWCNQMGLHIGNSAPQTSLNGILLRNLEIQARRCVRTQNVAKLYGCRLKYTEFGIAAEYGNVVQALNTAILNTAPVAGSAAVYLASMQWANLENVYARGLGATSTYGLRTFALPFLAIDDVVVFESFNDGWGSGDGSGTVDADTLVLRNNAASGILFGAGATYEVWVNTRLELTGNGTAGVQQTAGGRGWYRLSAAGGSISNNPAGGAILREFSHLDLTDVLVNANGADGIRLAGSHNSVRLLGTTDVSGNAAWAVKCHDRAAGHNLIELAPSMTMGSNPSGDVSLDGTTNTSRASIAGAVVPNATYLNRAVGT